MQRQQAYGSSIERWTLTGASVGCGLRRGGWHGLPSEGEMNYRGGGGGDYRSVSHVHCGDGAGVSGELVRSMTDELPAGLYIAYRQRVASYLYEQRRLQH